MAATRSKIVCPAKKGPEGTMLLRSARRRLPLLTGSAALLIMSAVGMAAPAQAVPPAPTAPPVESGTATQPFTETAEEASSAAPESDSAKAVAEAIDVAKRSGRTTPIPSLTDEFSTTAASPDGSFSTTYSVTPERVQRNGKWATIDTTLVRHEDGSFGPKAAAAEVSFSGDGSTNLVALKNGRKALNFTWAEKLPKPAISGDTATYAEVLPDVDLRVTANATGYSSIFVVKTPQAAANPDVQQIDLGLTGTGVKIEATPDGGAEATDAATGETVFHANTALMWDSTPTNNTAAPSAAKAAPMNSLKAMQEDASNVGKNRAQVKVTFGAGKQTLTLDKALLTAKTTKYPVFVDPDWGVKYNGSQSAWARISSNGWNVYNSTSTNGSNSARIGLDDWPTGAGEKARTYYKIDLRGIKGATVKDAVLYLKHRWSASCSNTAAVVYATGAPAGWNSSTLRWGKEPTRGALLDTKMGREVNCGTSSPAASPASFSFNVSTHIQSVAKLKSDYAYFLAEAKNMNDKYSWKQLGKGGGANLTVQYSYPPTLFPADNKPHVTPSSTDQGKVMTTTPTPTLSWQASNRFPNGVVRRVTMKYHVMDKTGKLVAAGYSPGPNTYNKNGFSWPVTPKLPDGDYTWKVATKNEDGLWAGVWTPTQKLTIDTTAPKAPTIKSAQFPTGQIGGGFTDKGTFAFGNDKSNNINGYLFTLDGDLTNVTYALKKWTAWTATTTISPGTVYFAKSDNKDGTGAAIINGAAAPVFAPRTPGAHKLVAKAVDQAGSTSPQTTYGFNAGRSTPLYAYGDKMISGWTASNTDGTTTVVPKATTTSKTGQLIAQPASAGNYYVDGYHGMLANLSTTSKVANGDTATIWFNVPKTGVWEMGANLSTGVDYGTYSLTLDKGQPTETNLTDTNFDAYSASSGTRYLNFGIVQDARDTPLVLAQGLHSITLTLTGANARSTGYQAGIDILRVAPALTCAINDTKDCFNNTAISTYTSGATPAVTPADADGSGLSLDADELKTAGWNPGGAVTVHGASVKLPSAFGNGTSDNMLAAGQLITVPGEGVVNKGNSVVFLGFAVNGNVNDATGRITYAKDSGCNVASQAYTMDWVNDWARTSPGGSALTLPHRNSSAGRYTGASPNLMAISVPLVCPGSAVSSISLPLVSNSVEGAANALHILGLGIRPTSSTGDGDGTTRWVGSWSAAQDTSTVPALAGTTTINATLNAQTVRIPARLSIGTGTDPGKVRVRLANSLGKTPVTFDAASIAPQDTTAGGATAASTPLPLTFNGATSITLPAGTDVLSDPVELTMPDQATLLVSVKVRGGLTTLAGHLDARTPVYVSGADGANHTADTDATAFTVSTMSGLPFLAGIDVSTPTDNPAGALVLYGDQTINSDTATKNGRSQLSDHLATALASDNVGQTYALRAGVLNQGSSSRNNQFLLPSVSNSEQPSNSHGLIDREILAQTNARIVLISAGRSDLLTCTATATACASTVQTKLNALSAQLQQYKADDALNDKVNVPTSGRGLKVYIATLPPFTSTHTAAQETARQSVNAYILGPDMESHADGVIDFAAAVSTGGLATNATVTPEYLTIGSDGKSYPNDLYYQALAQQYRVSAHSVDGIAGDGEPAGADNTFPVAEWKFNEGDGTIAKDTGTGTGNPTDPQFHDASLTDVTWSLGRQADNQSGTFNGTSSHADTGLPLNTAKSFTVAAWVRLSDKTEDRTIVLTRAASGSSSLYLKYQESTDRWLAQMPSAASADLSYAESFEPARVGVWTHVAVVYDASDDELVLYVNGNGQGRIDVTAVNEPAMPTWIGGNGSTWFAGDIADVRVWTRVLDETDMAAEATPRTATVNWQFEDPSLADTAMDTSGKEANGTFTGGVTWKTSGHPNAGDAPDDMDIDGGAITLNGTDAAVSTKARLLTDQSFTATAWARLTKNTTDATVLGQAGTHSSGFQLNYNASCKCWRFTLPTTDSSTDPTSIIAQDPTPAAINTWTHLTGVYDAATGTAKLYINGTEVANTAVPAQTWNSRGQLIVGRAWWNDTFRDYFTGDIDDVQTFQEPLTARNIGELMKEETLTKGEPPQE